MYYEEKMINGIFMFRTKPFGKWKPCNIKRLSYKLQETLEKLKTIEKQLYPISYKLQKTSEKLKKVENQLYLMGYKKPSNEQKIPEKV